MSLREEYACAIQKAKDKFDGSAQEKDSKLHFIGSVKADAEKNEIRIKVIPDSPNDIVAQVVTDSGARSVSAAGFAKTYTVKPVDTLRSIAPSQLGNGSICTRIFDPTRPAQRPGQNQAWSGPHVSVES